MRIVATAVLVLVLAGVVGAQADDPSRYECPLVRLAKDAGPAVVVASTYIGVALRYELGRGDRVCVRRRQGREERLRSFPILGTARPPGPARNRAQLRAEDRPFDIDTSTATSIMIPETEGLPAYACFRLLSDTPAARLCLASDLDGGGAPAGKALFCNRGRCRERTVEGVSAVADLYQGVWRVNVALSDGTRAEALAVTKRLAPGRLSMELVLGARDVFSLRMRLEGRRQVRFVGDRATDAQPPSEVRGTGRHSGAANLAVLSINGDLVPVSGTVRFEMERTDADLSPAAFAQCWRLRLVDGAVESAVDLPLVVSTNGLGASRPTVEVAADGQTVMTLDAGNCAVTRQKVLPLPPTDQVPPPPPPTEVQVSCVIPGSAGAVRLVGRLAIQDSRPRVTTGAGEFAIGASGRVGTWTAAACPVD